MERDMSGRMVKSIIYVAKENQKTLATIAAAAAGLTYAEKHKEVKRQLEAKNIEHWTFEGDVSQVPKGYHHWHA